MREVEFPAAMRRRIRTHFAEHWQPPQGEWPCSGEAELWHLCCSAAAERRKPALVSGHSCLPAPFPAADYDPKRLYLELPPRLRIQVKQAQQAEVLAALDFFPPSLGQHQRRVAQAILADVSLPVWLAPGQQLHEGGLEVGGPALGIHGELREVGFSLDAPCCYILEEGALAWQRLCAYCLCS